MPQQSTNLQRSQLIRQRLGLGLAGLLIITLASLGGSQLWAAPHAQTVPPPTPPPSTTEEPRATATPVRDSDRDRGDDDDDNNSSPAPTATADAAAPSSPPITGVVMANRLNVRSGPTTSARVLGVATNGQTLTLLGRNADSSWWRVCCVTDTTTEGWVSADFVQLTAEAITSSALLPIADGITPAPTATSSAPITSTATISASAALTATPAAPSLEFVMAQSPSFAWQGQELVLTLTVTNTGETTASALEMRTELPAAFRFSEAFVTEGGEFSEELTGSDQVALTVDWPTIAAGAAASANIRIQIADDLADGVVLDILAVVNAAGGEPITAGVSIGMPPTTLPTFQ